MTSVACFCVLLLYSIPNLLSQVPKDAAATQIEPPKVSFLVGGRSLGSIRKDGSQQTVNGAIGCRDVCDMRVGRPAAKSSSCNLLVLITLWFFLGVPSHVTILSSPPIQGANQYHCTQATRRLLPQRALLLVNHCLEPPCYVLVTQPVDLHRTTCCRYATIRQTGNYKQVMERFFICFLPCAVVHIFMNNV